MQTKHDARSKAAADASAYLGVKIQISEWSNRCLEAVETQWSEAKRREPSFDWREIHRRFREPDQLDFAIWSGNRLCALGLARVRAEYVEFLFFEGDPRADCPIRGKRILVALEAVTNYVQGRGRAEIRLEPANDKLVDVYQTVYEFELVSPRKGKPYCRKQV